MATLGYVTHRDWRAWTNLDGSFADDMPYDPGPASYPPISYADKWAPIGKRVPLTNAECSAYGVFAVGADMLAGPNINYLDSNRTYEVWGYQDVGGGVDWNMQTLCSNYRCDRLYEEGDDVRLKLTFFNNWHASIIYPKSIYIQCWYNFNQSNGANAAGSITMKGSEFSCPSSPDITKEIIFRANNELRETSFVLGQYPDNVRSNLFVAFNVKIDADFFADQRTLKDPMDILFMHSLALVNK